jgi:hypothetical protein
VTGEMYEAAAVRCAPPALTRVGIHQLAAVQHPLLHVEAWQRVETLATCTSPNPVHTWFLPLQVPEPLSGGYTYTAVPSASPHCQMSTTPPPVALAMPSDSCCVAAL